MIIGAVLTAVISALIGRVIVIVVVVVLAMDVWQQRGHVKDACSSKRCDLNATFFDVSLDAPDSLKRACAGRSNS